MKLLLFAALLAATVLAQTPRPVACRIRLEKNASGETRFAPAELVAWAGDQIHWFNDTTEFHDPGVLDKDGRFVSFLEEPVAIRSTSSVFSPFARINKDGKMVAFTIPYLCRQHPGEKGIIQVIPTP